MRKWRRKWTQPGRFYTLRLWLAFGGWRDLWMFAITVVVAIALSNAANAAHDAKDTATHLAAEGTDRRDQNCVIFEGAQRDAVVALIRTYDFLEHTPPELKPFRKIVIAQLPETEFKARSTKAPPYCDDPGIGLPEPNLKIPKRPPNLVP